MEQEKQTVKTQSDVNSSSQQSKQQKVKVQPKVPPKPMPKVPPKPQTLATSNSIGGTKNPESPAKPARLETKVEANKTNDINSERSEQSDQKVIESKKDVKRENNASQKRVKKPNETFYKTIRVITDVLFVPFFVIVIFSTILMFSAKMRNEVPSLFGYSAVKILTPSMVDGKDDEYYPNDIVLVKACNPEDLAVGDIIAFYEPMVETDENELVTVSTSGTNANISTTLLSFLGNGASNEYQRASAKNYSRVLFHRIVAISTPSNPADENYGKLFFQTQGDANATPDGEWVMEDYVVGMYISTNSFIGNLFQFCTTTLGMVLLIILPSALLIFLFVIDIFGQSKQLKYEKLVEKEGGVEIEKQINEDDKTAKTLTETDLKRNKQKEKKREEILSDILSEADAKSNKTNDIEKSNFEKSQNANEKQIKTTEPQKPEIKVVPKKPEVKKPEIKSEPKKPNINSEPKKPNINSEPKKPDIKKPNIKK